MHLPRPVSRGWVRINKNTAIKHKHTHATCIGQLMVSPICTICSKMSYIVVSQYKSILAQNRSLTICKNVSISESQVLFLCLAVCWHLNKWAVLLPAVYKVIFFFFLLLVKQLIIRFCYSQSSTYSYPVGVSKFFCVVSLESEHSDPKVQSKSQRAF